MPRLIDAAYEQNWCSAVGALAGALRALGLRLPIAHVSALSGHAFRFALVPAPEGEIAAESVNHFSAASAVPLYQNLGWSFEFVECAEGDTEMAHCRLDTLRRVRRSLDRGRPAILYGLHLPEFGIVRGYERSDLYASTIVSSQYGERIPAEQWPAPGHNLPIRGFFPERRVKVDADVALERLLRFASTYATAREGGEVTAATGLAAFGRWIALLQSNERISGRGQAHVIQALQSGRAEAAAFLRDEAERLPEIGLTLREAATAYMAVVMEISRMATLFPFPSGGDATSRGTRHAGAAYVRRAQEAEERALAAVERALATLAGRARDLHEPAPHRPIRLPWRRT